MKAARAYILSAGAFLVMASAVTAVAAPGDVKQSLPAPCKYPVGLTTDGTDFFLLDWRSGLIYRLSAAGELLGTFSVAAVRPHGLAYHDGRLYVSDEHTGAVHVLRCDNGTLERSFSTPGRKPTGLAFVGDDLYVLDASANRIAKVDAEGKLLARFRAPTQTATGLGSDGRRLWVTDRTKDELYLVDPAGGTVLAILDAPGPYPEGVCGRDGTLWVVDFQDRKLNQLALHDAPHYRTAKPRDTRIEFIWSLRNHGPGEIRDMDVYLAVPGNLPAQQLLGEVEYSTPPVRLAQDRWGQTCAVFQPGVIPAGQRQSLSYSVKARVSSLRYFLTPEHTGTLADIPAALRAEYTADGALLRVNSSYVRRKAREIVGAEQNPYWIARKIYNRLIVELEYELDDAWDNPETVLRRGSGSCSEYTFAFIALCRAAGLPARYCGSIAVKDDEAGIDERFHRWAEVYLPNYGWIPVDANRGDLPGPADEARGFGELSSHYLITTAGGGDSECLAWSYNSHAQFRAGGVCNAEEESVGLWEPIRREGPTAAAGAPRTGIPPAGAYPTVSAGAFHTDIPAASAVAVGALPDGTRSDSAVRP